MSVICSMHLNPQLLFFLYCCFSLLRNIFNTIGFLFYRGLSKHLLNPYVQEMILSQYGLDKLFLSQNEVFKF